MSKTTIPTGGITADAINGTLIADDAINSEHYTDGSIDTAHIGDSQVTAAKTSGVGGRATLLNTTTVSSAVSNVDMTDVMSDTYNNYLLVIHNGIVASDGADVRITFFSGSGTSTHIASSDNYRYAYSNMVSDNTFNNDYSSSQVFFRPNRSGIGNSSDETFNGRFDFFNFRSTSRSKLIHGIMAHASTGGHGVGVRSVGIVKPTSAISGLRFELSTGNIAGGTFKLYGME